MDDGRGHRARKGGYQQDIHRNAPAGTLSSVLARSEILAVRQASVSLSGCSILKDVEFTLESGEFCGLIGSNGSGKTTLLRTILGFVPLDRGNIMVEREGAHASIGYVPQKFALDPYIPMRARDLVALGLDGNRLGIPLPSARRRRQVDDILAAVDATQFADQRIGQLVRRATATCAYRACPDSPPTLAAARRAACQPGHAQRRRDRRPCCDAYRENSGSPCCSRRTT